MRSLFGEVLALLHSGLTDGERYDEWRRIRDGRVDVVLGARSAVFAPIPGLGLIVVDEEHDASYKQQEHPRYNGRDLAILRGKLAKAVVILGSATPSMETFLGARRGRYRMLSLPGRIGSAGLPPGARVARLDRDTARGRGAVESLLTRVERGEVDILLGTQMIAKGHDFPNVTLVGVVAADALLALPDFRAGERAFQLLAQVAGRSGRGERAGEVIVQAYYADHHAIRSACDHDYAGFAARELVYRRAMNSPAYAALAVVLVKGRVFERARGEAEGIARTLRGLGGRRIQVLGPAPAPLERLRGDYRVQILVKAPNRKDLRATVADALQALDRIKLNVENLVIDIDPMSTL